MNPRIVTATRDVRASAAIVFGAIADPSRQPEWDGNDNLSAAEPGQRVTAACQVFRTTLTMGSVRENHVVEFVEGRLIAWKPAEPGRPPVGHLWRWELTPLDAVTTRVRHTYDWTDMHDEQRLERARSTTSERLMASIDRLALVVEPLQ